MNLASHPEANRLAYRIKAATTGESIGLETAKLAWQQAEAVARANADLQTANAHIEANQPLLAALVESAHPRLIETAKALEHPHAKTWTKRCGIYGWRVPDSIDHDAIAKLEASLAAQGELKEWLYHEYRAAVRESDQMLAYRIIRAISQRHPDDLGAKQETSRLSQQLLEKAASEAGHPDDLAPYLAIGLPLSEAAQPKLAEALEAYLAQHDAKVSARVAEVVDGAEQLDENSWQELEKPYLACDYDLAITGARGRIDDDLRTRFENVATKLSRRRSNYESIISIRLAIADLRQSTRSKKTPGKKSPKLADRLEKLRSLERQALTTAGQLPADLQKEIKAAYAYAWRRRMPLFATLGATGLAAVIAIVWQLNIQRAQALEAQNRNDALVALHHAELSKQTRVATQALYTWSGVIENSPADSPLVEQAAVVEQWLADQNTLQTQYKQQLEALEELVGSAKPLQERDRVQELATQLQATRDALAIDLGQPEDLAKKQLLDNWTRTAKASQQKLDADLARLEKQLELASRNANQAKTGSAFQQLSADAHQQIRAINVLLPSDRNLSRVTRLKALTSTTERQLIELETKWGAFETEWRELQKADNLASYFDSLKRIHSFDILPPEQESAIAQTLRLEPRIASLKSEIVLAGEKPAAQRYASQPELSPAERAYLERLGEIDAFENVYQSTVQYFEGSSTPQSEYKIYLVEPIAKSDTTPSVSHVSFSFKVRGFDEFGNPEKDPRDIQFISRGDGSFWGFFYKPSTLSPESEYYIGPIRNTLAQMAAGADRFTLIQQIVDLENEHSLAPAFKIFWQQRLIGFMQLNPWKWGLALSPTLQARASELAKLSNGEMNERVWLSIIEQTVPSPDYRILEENHVGELALREANALSAFYETALSGRFTLAGSVLADQQVDLMRDVRRDEPLWSLNALSGNIEPLGDPRNLLPFAPILRYELEGGSPGDLVQKSEFASGLKLSQPPYANLLPPIFQSAKNASQDKAGR